MAENLLRKLIIMYIKDIETTKSFIKIFGFEIPKLRHNVYTRRKKKNNLSNNGNNEPLFFLS